MTPGQKRAQDALWNHLMDQAIEQSKYPEMLEDLKAQLRTAELEIQRQAILLAKSRNHSRRPKRGTGHRNRDVSVCAGVHSNRADSVVRAGRSDVVDGAEPTGAEEAARLAKNTEKGLDTASSGG